MARSSGGDATAKALLYRDFWEYALEQIRRVHPEWTRARTSNQSWCNTSLGLGGMVAAMAWVNGVLVAQIYFDSSDGEVNQTRFDGLHERRETFEAALGQEPLWDGMPGRKGARILLTSTFDDLSDSARWPDMVEWLITQQARLRAALAAIGGVPAVRSWTVASVSTD